jgi:hypothetical protein
MKQPDVVITCDVCLSKQTTTQKQQNPYSGYDNLPWYERNGKDICYNCAHIIDHALVLGLVNGAQFPIPDEWKISNEPR